MYFLPKQQEVIPFRDFMDGSYKKQQENMTMYASSLAFPFILGFGKSTIVEKIAHAFDPLLAVVQGIAYPISFLSLSAGFIFISLGQKTRGMHLIKYSIIGFVGLQFAPAIMDILVTIAQEIAGSLE